MTLPEFYDECRDNAARMARDPQVQALTHAWMKATEPYKYSYNYQWMGRPIIQFPPDMVVLQEIVWNTRPDIVIETGVAHGGTAVFYASLLELLGGDGIAVGVDIEVRPHNRKALEEHPLFKRIRLVEGSSTDPAIVDQVRRLAAGRRNPMVVLDSNHSHDHVLRELELYSPLIRKGGYMVVLDTIIEDFPAGSFPNRPWDKGNNPKTAVWEFLKKNDRFVIDKEVENKLLITVAPDGYLRCVKD